MALVQAAAAQPAAEQSPKGPAEAQDICYALGGPGLLLSGLFFAPASEIKKSEKNQKIQRKTKGQQLKGKIRQEASITWCDLFWPTFGKKMPKIISLHDVLEPLNQALLASRDVVNSGRICGSTLQKVFTLGDGCWLPKNRFGHFFTLFPSGLSLKIKPYPKDPAVLKILRRINSRSPYWFVEISPVIGHI